MNISYYNKILRIRRKIHPIYIPNLNEKINIDNGVVAGKDIIAFMGDTGAGKTTIIQIILGYKLI
jgi:flagellar biosynthesis GTPase FlhF